MGTDQFGLIVSIPLNYNPDHNKLSIAKLTEQNGFNLKPGDVCDAIHNLMHPDLKKDQSAMIQGFNSNHNDNHNSIFNIIKELCFQNKWVQMPNFSPSIKESESFILNINNGFYHVYKDYPLYKERDEYLFGSVQDWTINSSGFNKFSDIEYGLFMHLSTIEDVTFYDGQIQDSNRSPCNGDFVEFMMEHEEFTCSGYATIPGLHSNITITGLKVSGLNKDSFDAFNDWCYKSQEWMSPLSFVSRNYQKDAECSWIDKLQM